MNIDDYVSGPALLRSAVAGMAQDQLVVRPIPGKWSTLEVICHLADFEIVYADRIKRVIVENEPTLFSGDPNEFAARLAYHQRNTEEELLLIGLIRQQVARILRTLTPEDFQRRGIHSQSGPMTLETLVERITGHIPHHVQFIEEKRKALTRMDRRLEERSGRPQEKQEARTTKCGLLQCEGRYAELGHLLPMFHSERAVKPGVSALPRSWSDN